MEKKMYRLFLAITIAAVMVAGFVYYQHYKEKEMQGDNVTLVENLAEWPGGAQA